MYRFFVVLVNLTDIADVYKIGSSVFLLRVVNGT